MKSNNFYFRKCLFFLIITLIFIFSSKISSQSSDYTSPEIKDDGIYFRCFNSKAKKVFLISSFDEWSYLYAFYKKNDNVWELKLPINDPLYQLKKGYYKYKFIIDGITTYDNLNPYIEKDDFGFSINILEIPFDLYDYSKSPLKIGNNIYRFFISSEIEATYEIAGSFNNFVPEEMKNDEMRQKLFYKDFILSPDIYYYSFIKNGVWDIDHKNDSLIIDITGRKLSKVIIE